MKRIIITIFLIVSGISLAVGQNSNTADFYIFKTHKNRKSLSYQCRTGRGLYRNRFSVKTSFHQQSQQTGFTERLWKFSNSAG
jgi:hypothetical protein